MNARAKLRAKEEKDQEIEAAYELKVYEETQTAKVNVAKGISGLIATIAGKNKDLQKAGMIAEKGLAVAEIIIQTEKANAALRANAVLASSWAAPLGPGYPPVLAANMAIANGVIMLNNTTEAINIATISAGVVMALAGFSRGGRINRGIPVNTGTSDNLLIAVNRNEAVINQNQIAALGGSGAMRYAGVPGFAGGGYIGTRVPEIPPSPISTMNSNIQSMSNRISNMEVVLNVNKLNRAQYELDVITNTQKI